MLGKVFKEVLPKPKRISVPMPVRNIGPYYVDEPIELHGTWKDLTQGKAEIDKEVIIGTVISNSVDETEMSETLNARSQGIKITVGTASQASLVTVQGQMDVQWSSHVKDSWTTRTAKSESCSVTVRYYVKQGQSIKQIVYEGFGMRVVGDRVVASEFPDVLPLKLSVPVVKCIPSRGRATQLKNNLGHNLRAGSVIEEGDYMQSSNKRFRFICQGDGNMVVYDDHGNGRVVWASRTDGWGSAPFRIRVHEEGYFGLHQSDGEQVAGFGHYLGGMCSLVLQDDGNLVLLQEPNPERVVWSIF